MKVFGTFPENYELIDAGGGRKLERWGEIITIRPEHQAYFKPGLSDAEWKRMAHWMFQPAKEGSLNGTWKALKEHAPKKWTVRMGNAVFNLEITSNKHLGLFPEQHINWEFITQFLTPEKRFLNAFAYTGAASIYGKITGAEVIHCDSMRGMLDWGRLNMESSNVYEIKWVLEDALKFIQREQKRGNTYDLIQMDPPAWGMGAKGEKWKLEELISPLIDACLLCLNPKGVLIVNTYSPKLDEAKSKQLLMPFKSRLKSAECNELWLTSTSGKQLYYGILTRLTKA